VWCYKLVFDLVVVNTKDFFEISTVTQTQGHRYKLFKKSYSGNIRTTFFASVSSTWNKLPAETDFSSLIKFKPLWTFLIIFSVSSLNVNYCNYVFIVFLLCLRKIG